MSGRHQHGSTMLELVIPYCVSRFRVAGCTTPRLPSLFTPLLLGLPALDLSKPQRCPVCKLSRHLCSLGLLHLEHLGAWLWLATALGFVSFFTWLTWFHDQDNLCNYKTITLQPVSSLVASVFTNPGADVEVLQAKLLLAGPTYPMRIPGSSLSAKGLGFLLTHLERQQMMARGSSHPRRGSRWGSWLQTSALPQVLLGMNQQMKDLVLLLCLSEKQIFKKKNSPPLMFPSFFIFSPRE